MAKRENCTEEAEDVLTAIKDALDGHKERGYFSGSEVAEVSELAKRWRTCLIEKEHMEVPMLTVRRHR